VLRDDFYEPVSIIEGIMRKNSSDNHPPGNDSFAIFKPAPFSLFVTSVVTIFVAEAFVMLLIYSLDLHSLFFIGLVDAVLLSLFVVP
jgi:hypothetical protein